MINLGKLDALDLMGPLHCLENTLQDFLISFFIGMPNRFSHKYPDSLTHIAGA